MDRRDQQGFLKELKEGKYLVFKYTIVPVNLSILEDHFYDSTSQVLHLLEPSSPTLTPKIILHPIFLSINN